MRKFYTLFYILALAVSIPVLAQGAVYEETLSYCGSEMQQYGIGAASSTEIGVAAYYPQITDYEGNSIARIRIGFVGSVSNVYVFVSQSLDGEPLYEQRAMNMHQGWNEVELETPVEIGSEPLYVGYTCRVPGGAYSIGISTLPPCENSIFLDSGSGYADMSSTYSPLSLEVVVSGSNFTANAASVSHVQHSFVDSGTADIQSSITIANDGAEPINSLEVSYAIGGTNGTTQLQGLSIPRYGSSTVNIGLPAMPAGDYDITYELTQVNGVANENATSSYTAAKRVHVLGESLPRVAVCEEYCGNLCGYCPAGIVAIEQLKEKYPDSFIAIAAHVFNNSDPYYLWDYESPLLSYVSSAPSFIINRSTVLSSAFPADGTASGENLIEENALLPAWNAPTCGQVSVYADRQTFSGSTLEVTVVTTFNVDMEQSPFLLCLVATEDGLAGTQMNYYSGGDIEMGGWENLPMMAEVTYDDVAIALVDFYGIEGSLPESVAAGTSYEYTYNIDLSRASNIDNVDVIALLVNTETGEVVNASGIVGASGIEEMTANGGSHHFKVLTTGQGITIEASTAAYRTYRLYSPSGSMITSVKSAEPHVVLPKAMNGLYILQIEEKGCTVHAQKLVVK